MTPEQLLEDVARAIYEADLAWRLGNGNVSTWSARAALVVAIEACAKACHPHADDDSLDAQCKRECAASIRSLKPKD